MHIQYLISHKQLHMSDGLTEITTTGQRLSVFCQKVTQVTKGVPIVLYVWKTLVTRGVLDHSLGGHLKTGVAFTLERLHMKSLIINTKIPKVLTKCDNYGICSSTWKHPKMLSYT